VSEPIFVERAPAAGREHRIGASATIGRKGCDIELPDDSEVSRRHALVRREGEALVIQDLGSTNGTFVNGERIEAPRRLVDGDEVSFGDTVWALQAAVEVVPQAPADAAPHAPADAARHAPAEAAPHAPADAAPHARGDVPAPDFQPSAIQRLVPPPGGPAAFAPVSGRRVRGSAATRLGATVAAAAIVALTTAGVIAYYVTEPFK
jgi:hypothetical protein